MIVSASYRTDIPAFYGRWFLRRLEAGFCWTANPYGGPPARIRLTADAVEGFVFWSKNPAPFGAALSEVRRRGIPFVLQFTITGYPDAIEAAVPPAARSIAAMERLAVAFGPAALVWRYDPILLTTATDAAWHRRQFARLARALVGMTDEVVISFAQIYTKSRRNLEAAGQRHGLGWRDPAAAEKRALLRELAAIAGGHGLRLALCAQPELAIEGTAPARCIDAARLARVAGRAAREAPAKGNRPGCLCAESRDIGAYDSCPQGCVYCYAVRRPAVAQQRLKEHDPDGPFLIPPRAVAKTDPKRAQSIRSISP